MEVIIMKIISAEVYNFGSYKYLKFDFDNQGLCLIQGATGSGKSTLCDIATWTLFGVTAKDGAVDDVLSWDTEEVTKASVFVQVNQNLHMTITRIRGKGKNDLYHNAFDPTIYSNEESLPTRGKDVTDTQKIINELFQCTPQTYLSGAYFHEFSKTSQFFTLVAKERRLILEQLVDLTLAKTLQAKAADNKKIIKKYITGVEQDIFKNSTKYEYIEKYLVSAKANSAKFEADKARDIEILLNRSKNFEADKKTKVDELAHKAVEFSDKQTKELVSLEQELDSKSKLVILLEAHCAELRPNSEKKCKECGGSVSHKIKEELITTQHQIIALKTEIKYAQQNKAKILNSTNPYLEQLQQAEDSINTYTQQIEELKTSKNPHIGTIKTATSELRTLAKSYNELKQKEQTLSTELLDLELLAEVVDTFRASLITNTISYIQDETNTLLSNHFDAEIKVLFDVTNADKIDVTIYKDANECSYTQLSKGQRQLLKLCFGVSVMKAVSNHSGVSFNSVFFDEALSGLDDNLKKKSFSLFENLASQYSSVFVIDHNNDFKSLFNKKYNVQLRNGESIVECQVE